MIIPCKAPGCLIVLLTLTFSVSNTFCQTIENTGKLNYPRAFHESQRLPDGSILAFGGSDVNNDITHSIVYAHAERYDSHTHTWELTDPMSQPRALFASAVLNNGNIIAIGGDAAWGSYPLASCEIFDVDSKKWQRAASMNRPRTDHRAIKLQNGNILVVGGSNDASSELYDPVADKWTLTGNLSTTRGAGVALVMLGNGTILVTGGDHPDATHTAEIYNPYTGEWTLVNGVMSYPRSEHSAILLPSGNVLLTGGIYSQIGGQWSEEFNVTTQTFFRARQLATLTTQNNPMLLLDDGKVFFYSQGTFTTNTNAFQTYDDFGWSSKNTTLIGKDAFTIHKLFDGSILIVGGYSVQGGTQDCLLLHEGGVAPCDDIDLSPGVSGDTFCFGKDGNVTITSSQADVIYQAYIGSVSVGSSVKGSGTIRLSIPRKFITSGKNQLVVKASRTGCLSKILDHQPVLTAIQANIAKPVITNSLPLLFCAGGYTSLEAPTGFSGYLWSDGEMSASVTTKQSGFYSVRVFDVDGCSSPNSEIVEAKQNTEITTAGENELVCVDQAAYTLTGQSPAGGVWYGPGVASDGKFDPAAAGVGTHTLTYVMCNSSQKTITVIPPPTISDFIFEWEERKICEGNSGSFFIRNTQDGVNYQLRIGTQNIGSEKTSDGGVMWFRTDNMTATTVFNVMATDLRGCHVVTLVKSDTLFVVATPKNVLVKAMRDSVCLGEATSIKITASQTDIDYYIQNPASDPLGGRGTGQDVYINTGSIAYSSVYTVIAKNSLNCSLKIKDIPIIVKPLTVDFSTGLPGDFVGDTIRIMNNSDAKSYRWSFLTPASLVSSTMKDPGLFSYSSTGKKSIQLIGTSSIGCIDTLTKEIEISNRINSGPAVTPCFKESSAASGQVVLDYHIDQHKNSYVAGYVYDGVFNAYNMFCMKTDSLGKQLWLKTTSNYHDATSFGTGITSDKEGNTYVSGHFFQSFTFGKFSYGHAATPRTDQMFVVKLNRAGEEQWMLTGNTDENSMSGYTNWMVASDIACDKNNNRIYITGHRSLSQCQLRFPDGQVNIVEDSRTNRSARDCFILEIDSAGAFKDYMEFGGGKDGYLVSPFGAAINGWYSASLSGIGTNTVVAVNPKIRIDYDGDLLIGGAFAAGQADQPFEIGDFRLYTKPSYNSVGDYLTTGGSVFVAEYNKDLGWKSAIKTTDGGIPYLQEFTKDKDGNVYTIGPVGNSTVIQGDTIELERSEIFEYDEKFSFLIKTNTSDNSGWHTISKSALLHDVEVSNRNTVFVTGALDRFGVIYSADRRPFGIQSVGAQDYFLGEYTADGQVVWANAQGTPKDDMPFFMEVDNCNNIYVCAAVNSPRNFWPYFIRNGATEIAKYSPAAMCGAQTCTPRQTDIFSFDPKAGSEGTTVSIYGKNFTYTSNVKFNDTEAVFAVMSDTVIMASVPTAATTGRIKLVSYEGAVTSLDDFIIKQAVKFIDFIPRHGGYGTTVNIRAEHASIVKTVMLNGKPVQSFTILNDSTIIAVIPQNATTGLVDLVTDDETVSSPEVFIVDVLTSVEMKDLNSCILFPNPASKSFTIDCFTWKESTTIRILNSIGSLVYINTIGASRSIDIAELPPGLYKVILVNDEKRYAYSLVKQ